MRQTRAASCAEGSEVRPQGSACFVALKLCLSSPKAGGKGQWGFSPHRPAACCLVRCCCCCCCCCCFCSCSCCCSTCSCCCCVSATAQATPQDPTHVVEQHRFALNLGTRKVERCFRQEPQWRHDRKAAPWAGPLKQALSLRRRWKRKGGVSSQEGSGNTRGKGTKEMINPV